MCGFDYKLEWLRDSKVRYTFYLFQAGFTNSLEVKSIPKTNSTSVYIFKHPNINIESLPQSPKMISL